MRVIIVTQTFPPRFGGMQSVMSALAKNFSKTIATFVLPDHYIPESHPIRNYKIKFNFSKFPKFLRPLIKKIKLKKILKKDDIIINENSISLKIEVSNIGDRPIQVGSHYHFYEVNSSLKFNRELSLGKRLDIPSGTAIRFEPGQIKEVDIIDYNGKREVYGFNGYVNGKVK